MIPKRILLKNFLSFGEPATEFVFAADEPLWVLCGPNGIGKSSVFDAITYALYGRHRGGTINAHQLVRHGTNGFEVEFDFEFNGTDYRIRRTRQGKKGARTTQHLRKLVAGEWKCVRGNDPAGAVTADDIEKWVTETFGLGYEAFTNSVLLRQGEADKLFSAGRDERIEVLKGIIGFEQFEALSDRVHTATVNHAKTAEGLAVQLANREPVTDEQLAVAEQAVKDANAALANTQNSWAAAIERVGQAKQWERLEKQRKELERQLAEAEQRQQQGSQIRADKAKLDDLTKAVPVLEALFKVRGRIGGLQEKLTTAYSALRLKELALGITQCERLLLAVVAVESVEAALEEYPKDLDAQVDGAATAEEKAKQALGEARDAKTRAETLFCEAKKQQEQFAGVAGGAICSRCRQLVSLEHARTEQAQLAENVKERQEDCNKAESNAKTATSRHTATQTHLKHLQDSRTEREKLVMQLIGKRDNLSALGAVESAAELRARLVDLLKQKANAEGRTDAREEVPEPAPANAKRLEAERNRLDGEVKTAQRVAAQLKSDLDTAQGEEKTTLDRLSDQWKKRLSTLDANCVAELASERDKLIADRVDEKFRALEQDDAKWAEWQKQLGEIRSDIENIPVEGRILPKDAEQYQSAAKTATGQAADDCDIAVSARNELSTRKQEYDGLTAGHRDAAEKHRIHKKLDELLGQTKLQRELVRDAEEQIIAFANETLQRLSDGELALEEDTAPESTRAFDLRVRPVGGEPIGVAFLSGSQRFRVAVSVALAVGRFASGRARPLEGVIIDEGFGSLDRDGLRVMAEEIKRLQRANALKRVILVSHQPEFTDQFPVGYALAAGENGTTVTPFRDRH
jgi:DNA repair exonuclease SbcCD ATPase subunit